MQVVIVDWVDAWSEGSDMTLEKAKELKPIARTTVGFLVADNDDCIIMCNDYFHDPEGEIHGPMVIPKDWVTHVRALENETSI